MSAGLKRVICLMLWMVFFLQPLMSQNYHAVYGSNYAGSLGIANNPASMVNTPYKWDCTLFAFQWKNFTNAVQVNNFSYLSPSASSTYQFREGNFKRYGFLNANAQLFNTRISLSRTKSIGFGLSMKNYENIKTGAFNFVDTIKITDDFLQQNASTGSFDGKARGMGWAEFFISYAQTVIDNDMIRINAGATLKVSRGLAAARVDAYTAGVQTVSNTGGLVHALGQTSLDYGYSSSIDRWNKNYSTSQNLRRLYEGAYGGASVDAGIEYIIKTQAVTDIYDDDDYYDYTWKIGLSLLDVGFNQFYYGRESRLTGVSKNSAITGAVLDEKFKGITNLKSFNDSLATIADKYIGLSGPFNMIHPARMVLNVDRYLTGNFFVNGELSLNLSPLAGDKRLYVRETNLLTITPRWEKQRWGVYVPMQVSTEGKFMMGGAIKAGPLVAGFHNLSNIFLKNTMQNGGGYLALVIHPAAHQTAKKDRRLNCP